MLRSLIRLAIATAVIVLQLALLPSGSAALEVCVNKTTGAVRALLKGMCRKAETEVTLNTTTHVVDSRGLDVGQAYPYQYSYVVSALREINDIWIALPVDSSAFTDSRALSPFVSSALTEYFATSNCSGSPYVEVPPYYYEVGGVQLTQNPESMPAIS